MNRIEFLAERKSGIGGSDCAAVLGMSRWKTPVDVWMDKTAEDITDNPTDAQHIGTLLEPVVLREYENKTGAKCVSKNEMVKSSKYPWMLAHPDALVPEKKLVVEAKTTRFFDDKEWGEEFTDQIPQEYLIQVAHYCVVCGEESNIDGADIAALGSTSDFRIYHYERNKELEELIIERTHDFWKTYVVAKEMPPITQHDNLSKIYRKSDGAEIEATSDLRNNIKKYHGITEQIKILERQKDEISHEIKGYMKEAAVLTWCGEKLATWKNTKGRFDSNEFKAQHADLYEKFCKKEGSRVLLIKGAIS